jgi:hypothetical protein
MRTEHGSWARFGRLRNAEFRRRTGICLAVAALSVAAMMPAGARAADDVLQQAVNYVFTGRVDPVDVPEIVDRKTCAVVIPDTRNKRFARYFLSQFKLDAARFNKRYSGSRAVYDLDVQGDDVILEYLATDKTTVLQAYKSAQIPLPGDFEATQKALRIVSDNCKEEGPKSPF